MSDLQDVENAIVTAIAATLYPTGTSNPSAIGDSVRIYRGWPAPNLLDKDVANGVLNVSIFPQETERRTTRYTRDEIDLPRVNPTLTLTASGSTVTVGGTPSASNAAVTVGTKTYVTPVTASSTLNGIAAALATLISADTPASSTGAVLTVTGKTPKAKVGAIGGTVTEIRRQRRTFQITCWCPTPETRDELASFIDFTLAQIDYLALPDGTAGRLLYERSAVSDRSQEEGVYRRDLFYSVEYGTTLFGTAAEVVTVGIGITEAVPTSPTTDATIRTVTVNIT